MSKYFQPKSLTWWGSVALGVVGALKGAGIEIPEYVFLIILAITGVGVRGAMPK